MGNEQPKTRMVVTGATGFIGRNLVEHFAGKPEFEIFAVYHSRRPYPCPNVTWIEADLTRQDDVARVTALADVLLHAAATTSGAKDIVTRPHIHVTDNAVMNSLMLRAAFESKIKHFVFFSCSVMLQSSEKPQTEDDFNAGEEINKSYFGAAWTKIYIEKMCEFFSRIGSTRFTVIRHSNIYGPYDKFDLERSHVFGATVTKVMTATNGRVVVWGSGEEARDLLHVRDLVEFVDLALQRQPAAFGLYNCGLGRAVAVRDLVAKVAAASGRRLAIEFDLDRPTIKTSLSLDCSKAERELGWTAKIDLDQGIGQTLAWWRQYHGDVT